MLRRTKSACRTLHVLILVELMARIARVGVSPAETAKSFAICTPLAAGAEGDTPLAERRAAALALDGTLLAELLGCGASE